VLFLDELPEFSRHVLEVLREPLESGRITISRAAMQADFPAAFQFIAAMNPCPCGYLGHYTGQCKCSPDVVARYRRRISGPLMDRIDLHVTTPALEPCELERQQPGEASSVVRERVRKSRERQVVRQGKPNARLEAGELDTAIRIEAPARKTLRDAAASFALSARGHHRVLRVARTIADLAARETVSDADVSEALHYRGAPRREG
jgi:magnesium chelatase family protein